MRPRSRSEDAPSDEFASGAAAPRHHRHHRQQDICSGSGDQGIAPPSQATPTSWPYVDLWADPSINRSRFCPGTAAGPRHLHTRAYNSPVLPIRRNHRPRPTPARSEALGRIQNFGSWSPYLVKQDGTCLGLEYSVFEDDLSDSADDDRIWASGNRKPSASSTPPTSRPATWCLRWCCHGGGSCARCLDSGQANVSDARPGAPDPMRQMRSRLDFG
jgi:hypothetical protein